MCLRIMSSTQSFTLALIIFTIFHVTLGHFINGLLPNGNFEVGPKPSQMKGLQIIDHKAIPHWEISGFVEYIKSGQKQGHMLLLVPEGKHALRLGEDALIKTKVKLSEGAFYSLTFSFARTCAEEEVLNISISPTKVAPEWGILPMQTIYSSHGFDSYSWGFLAESNDTEISIHNPVRKEKDPACGPLVDSIALKLLNSPKRTKGNFLKNGNFEEGPFIFNNTSSWGTLIPPRSEDPHSPLPRWLIESFKAVKYIDSTHFSVPEGKRAIELVAGREGGIVQIVRTVPNMLYDLTFIIGDAKNLCEGHMVVEVSAGKSIGHVTHQSSGKGQFKRASLQFRAVSTRTRIRFLSTTYIMMSDYSGSFCGPVIDDVRLWFS